MTPSKRLSYVDLLRGWANILMFETHAYNAFLRDSMKRRMRSAA